MPRQSLSHTEPIASSSSSSHPPPSSSPTTKRKTPVVEIPTTRPRASSHQRNLPSSPIAHHSADEIALIEAEKILHTGPAAKEHDLEDLDNPRNARHRRLEEARRKAEKEEEEGEETDNGPEEEDRGASPALTSGAIIDRALDQDPSMVNIPSDNEEEEVEEEEEPVAGPSRVMVEDDSSVASSDNESGEDDSDSSETDMSDEDEDGEDDEEEEMEKLLAAAKATAIARASGSGAAGAAGDGIEDQEDILDLAVDNKEDLAIPDISIPNLPKSHLQFSASGVAKTARTEHQAESSKSASRPRERHQKDEDHGLELDDRPYEKSLTKKERAAQPKKASTSELWATLPSTKSDLLPQMKRDYQALALANSLDPKRFTKGNNKLSKVPERFAIGTVIDAPRTLQRTTLQREFKYRPGEIVKNLVKDQEAEGYAKRKYEELQWAKMDQGRKKGYRKRGKW